MKCFIDLGAYNGDTLELAMLRYPDFDKFIGFEPVPYLYHKAKNRLKDKRIKLHRLAASSVSGSRKKMFVDHKKRVGNTGLSIGSGSTILKTKKSGNLSSHRYIRVRTINFAKYLKRNFSEDDFVILKIDIEGEEYRLLNHLIKKGSLKYIDQIFCEWHWDRIGMDEDEHKKLVSRLRSLGFDLTGDKNKDSFT
jgi:FkbM family methyltransferase